MGIFSKSSSKSPDEPGWLRRWVMPGAGRDDQDLDEIKRVADADVAAMEEENRRYFRQDGPGHQQDEL